MRNRRFYHPDELVSGETLALTAATSSHLIRVLRTRPGSRITLFNGNGHDYHAVTLDDHPRRTRVEIVEVVDNTTESPLKIHLLQGLSKNHRMEYSIQKATELGVRHITPLLCQHSHYRLDPSRQRKKHDHWEQLTISACEQCGRSVIPTIGTVQTLEACQQSLAKDSLKLYLEPTACTGVGQAAIARRIESAAHVDLLIGPEGGLSTAERATLEAGDWLGIKLGPRVLRTETAGPVAIAALQTLYGDL